MRITVLIENTALSDTLTAEHGLSLYLEYRGTSCCWTPGAAGAFASNADKLEIDLAKVETCLLSHGHYDMPGDWRSFSAATKPLRCMPCGGRSTLLFGGR